MVKKDMRQHSRFENLSTRFTDWVGSTASLIVHTIFFVGIFFLRAFGVPVEDILLILTTVVSLEAIYLAIFIQMTVNRNTQSLQEVEEDIDEIQEDVEEIEKDIDEIQGDVDEIQEDDIEDDKHDVATMKTLTEIQTNLVKLMGDIEALKQEKKSLENREER